jgi:hypothetical protein
LDFETRMPPARPVCPASPRFVEMLMESTPFKMGGRLDVRNFF